MNDMVIVTLRMGERVRGQSQEWQCQSDYMTFFVQQHTLEGECYIFFRLFLWAVCLYHLVLKGMYWNLTGVTWQTVLFAKIVVGRELGWKIEMLKNDKPIIHLPNWKKASLHISYFHRLAFLYCRWQSNWYHFYTKDFLACQKTGFYSMPESRIL